MKFSTILIILFNFPGHLCLETCDPAYCNHEGQCSIKYNNKTCNCIGSKYFEGARCLEKIDNCRENACENGGQCYSLVGQFICTNCNEGFAGLRCDVKLRNVFHNMVLLFNHYGHFSTTHKFLLMVEDLGSTPFSVEFVADNYVIDSFECNPQENNSEWLYSTDLPKMVRHHGVRYYNDLPFGKGFYRLINKTFWDLDLLTLTLKVYDAETANELLYYQNFDLLLKKLDPMKCVPKLRFLHGSNPLEPLMVDIARFNNFKAIISKRCNDDSKVTYKWSIFNSIGSKKLHNFGVTQVPLLKIPPYRLWFNYHGVVMSSYSLVLKMVEKWKNFTAVTERRCFIMVLPKPVKAIIKGGLHREHGVDQSLLLDGSESRDFALAAPDPNKLLYHWKCTSLNDSVNSSCNTHLSSNDQLVIKPHQLKPNVTYEFSLTIQSKINIFIKDVAVQTVIVVKHSRLFIHIHCVRNCERHKFIIDSSIHLRIECIPKNVCSKQHSKFQWIVDGTTHGSAQRFIYKPKVNDSQILITAKVLHKGLEGKCSLLLARNEPPAGGQCFVQPQEGVAFQTTFHIYCAGYQDNDAPLTFYYMTNDFPLERINDPDVHYLLPECVEVVVKICDQFEACAKELLPVNISPIEGQENIASLLAKSNITNLIKNEDRVTAMIFLKSLTSYINTESDIVEIMAATDNLTILTLVEMEQWLCIIKDFVKNLLPLNNRKSFAMLGFFKKLLFGLLFIRNDKELENISVKSYEQVLQKFGFILEEFSKTWEFIPRTDAKQYQKISASDPLAEEYKELPEFDIFILETLANWLEPSRLLHKCLEIICSHARYVYYPTEVSTIRTEGKFITKIYAVEEMDHFNFYSGNQAVDTELFTGMQNKFPKNSIILQMLFLQSNPFWWYPIEQPLTMEVFSFAIYPTNQATLRKPFGYKILPKEFNISSPAKEVLVSIRNYLHMPIYFLKLPPNSAVIVTLVKANVSVCIDISIGKRPRSFLMRKSNRSLTMVINRYNQPQITYIAALANKDKKNISFHF